MRGIVIEVLIVINVVLALWVMFKLERWLGA